MIQTVLGSGSPEAIHFQKWKGYAREDCTLVFSCFLSFFPKHLLKVTPKDKTRGEKNGLLGLP